MLEENHSGVISKFYGVEWSDHSDHSGVKNHSGVKKISNSDKEQILKYFHDFSRMTQMKINLNQKLFLLKFPILNQMNAPILTLIYKKKMSHKLFHNLRTTLVNGGCTRVMTHVN